MKTLCFLVCVVIGMADASKILVLSPLGSKSHKIFFMSITDELLRRGHQVTFVSGYKESKEIKNFTDVVVPVDVTQLLANIFDEDAAKNMMTDLFMKGPYLCNDGLAETNVQDLKKEKFDIVLVSIFFNNCYLSLVHHYQVPFIYMSPAGLFEPFLEFSGNIEIESVYPNKLLEATFPQTFVMRLKTFILNKILGFVMSLYIIPRTESVCRERGLCPTDMPPLDELARTASFSIINSIRPLEVPPRPIMPNTIYAGGAHLHPGKPLPEELERWIEGSGEAGFIFFSLGSAITKPSDMPAEYRKTLINVFGSLKQRVLWKWDAETMLDLPPNVKLGKWLPQQDILAHKKFRLFITHGGQLSTMESSYHGVPVIGMPLFADQFANMKEVVEEGWGRLQTWKDLSEDSLKSIINEVLNNKELQIISKKRSTFMRDLPPGRPADEAAFWVEYTIRHKGAPHLQSPIFMISWYERHNVDVWAVLLSVVLLLVYVVFRIVRAFVRHCFIQLFGGKRKKE